MSDKDGDYEFNETVAPWKRTTSARLRREKWKRESDDGELLESQEVVKVECGGCGSTWEPRDPESPPKFCKDCKAELEYQNFSRDNPDDTETRVHDEPEGEEPEEEESGLPDDLDDLFGG